MNPRHNLQTQFDLQTVSRVIERERQTVSAAHGVPTTKHIKVASQRSQDAEAWKYHIRSKLED